MISPEQCAVMDKKGQGDKYNFVQIKYDVINMSDR